MQNQSQFPPINSALAAMTGRCPRCGEGKLFHGFLDLRTECETCKLPNQFADSGDGPAVFVIMIVGFVIVGLVLWLEVSYQPPIWIHMVIWLPLTTVLAAAILRPLKGLMIGLQYKHNAKEGKLDV